MTKADYKLWIIYISLAIGVGLLIGSCSASKKSVSINKSNVDSTVHLVQKITAVNTTDSIGSNSKMANYNKVTDITYQVYYPKPGADPVLIPHIVIKENGTKTEEQQVHLQKKDTTHTDVKKDVKLEKKITQIEKKKIKIGFSWWWLLLLIPLVLLSKVVRSKLFSIFKKFIPI